MRISTKGRYALQLMIDLAIHDNGEYVSIKSVASRQGISEKYLEQIMQSVSRAGFVRSTRGPQGGYRLAKKPNEYTIGMILRLLEGSLSPVECLDEDVNQCSKCMECSSYPIWQKLNHAINSVVDTMTLDELVEIELNRYESDYMI